MKLKFLAILLVLINVPLFSRDIDLDAIYINSGSPLYKQIVAEKEKLYSTISSMFIDSNIIYAAWADGDRILYVKEFSGINIVYIYSKADMSRRELCRFPGTVTASVHNSRGNMVTLKTIYYNDDAEAESKNFHIDLSTLEIKEEISHSLFINFSPYPRARAITRQGKDGIYRYDPFTEKSSGIITQDLYQDMQCQGEPVIAYISPDEKKKLLICGNGGAYEARVISGGTKTGINGVTSAGDARWISNNRFIYRSGGGGDYSARVYDLNTKKTMELVSGSMNPDIHFSERPGLITCLENQMIIIFSADLKDKTVTGIEGEETSFSPDGRKFISILQGKLYVTSLTMVDKYQIEIRRNAENLLSLYRKASGMKNGWENEFTPEYIDKNISQYEKYLKKDRKKK